MSNLKISRSDSIPLRDEPMSSWLQDFFKSSSFVQDILNKPATVSDALKVYRDAVGLDLVNAGEEDENQIKLANFENKAIKDNDNKVKTFEENGMKKLSKRHVIAEENENKSVVALIEKDPDLKSSIDSLLEHSGGNKKNYSIIIFLRDKLGKELVSYSDDDLINYIDDRRKQFKVDFNKDMDPASVGRIGLRDDDYDDNTAEYAKKGK